jgi:hypothetical protein
MVREERGPGGVNEEAEEEEEKSKAEVQDAEQERRESEALKRGRAMIPFS